MTDDTISGLSNYAAINLTTASSCLTIDIANDAEISCLITNKGSVVKKGAGVLKLTNNSLKDGFNVQAGWSIEAGGVVLPQQQSPSKGGYNLQNLNIAKGAYLALCPTNDTAHNLNFAGGEGMITNLNCSAKTYPGCSLKGTFGGIIGTSISYGVAYGAFTFTGENYAGGGNSGIEDATFSVASSNGLGDAYQFMFGGKSCLTYIGEGDATWTKRFIVRNTANGSGISGGENGGLTVDAQEYFTLSDNVKDFYFDGAAGTNVFQSTSHASINSAAARLVKKGAGTWWFKHDYKAWERGGATEVREGKLMIDSLFDKGDICSLGVGTNAAKAVTTAAAYSEALAVPYGVLLSGGELEFIGSTNAAFAADRGIGVSADSALTDNGQNVIFGFAGVQCVGETPRTLTLGGTNTLSRLDEVVDGGAALSLKKVGSGTWTLGGNQTFSGLLDVQEGTVRVLNDGNKTKYTYFRLQAKESAYSRLKTSSGGGINIRNWGLFDANGNRLGRSVTDAATFGNGNLQENEAAWARDTEMYNHVNTGGEGGTPKMLFTESQYFGYAKALVNNIANYNERYPTLNSPRTWQRIVVRLPDDIAEVTSYDLITPSPTKNGSGVVSWSIDGSVDGIYWTQLDAQEYPSQFTNYKGIVSDSTQYWLYDNSPFVSGTGTHTGFKVTAKREAKTYSQLAQATVRVAADAELVAEGDVTLSSLSVDAKGAGTISGFKFAESGTVDITNAPKGMFKIAAKISAADTSLANVSKWNVSFDGTVNSKYHLRPNSAGGLDVFHDGLCIIVR